MLETFYPERYEKDAYGIPYKRLYEKGYRGIIFDVDNTLVPHGAPADGKAKALFEELRAIGFETCILPLSLWAQARSWTRLKRSTPTGWPPGFWAWAMC